jgi:hypothetical protein
MPHRPWLSRFFAQDADPLQHGHVTRCTGCREKFLARAAVIAHLVNIVNASTPEPSPDFAAQLEEAVLKIVEEQRDRDNKPGPTSRPTKRGRSRGDLTCLDQ